MATNSSVPPAPAGERPSRLPHTECGGVVVWSVGLCAALLIAAVGVGFVYVKAVENAHDGRMLPGTMVAGVDVGGMSEGEARDAVADVLAQDLDRSLTVEWGNEEWSTTPRELGVNADVDAAVAEAMEASESASAAELVRLRWQGDTADVAADVSLSRPRSGAREFVNGLAEELNEPARDAALNLESVPDGELEIVPGSAGRVVDTDATTKALMGALREEQERVELTVHEVPPQETVEDFRQVFVLRQDDHELDLYENGERVGTWDVAVGEAASGYPTPTGLYEVTKKRPNPTWVNPDPSGWGSGMPKRIGPGPDNPLGVRALNWSAPAIRFHGTANLSSIGTDASKGCVRLSNDDIVHVYDRVETGAKIVSLRSG